MTRSIPEWIGKTDDTPVPARVKDRLFIAADGKCENCARKLGGSLDSPEFDHRIALVNGGENRESNLQVLCPWCHAGKTSEDVRKKSITARKRQKHNGIMRKKALIPGSKGSGIRRPINGRAYFVEE